MAEKQDEILLNNTLKHDEIPIAIELAVALRADEVDKFLELYDNIPKTVQTERVDKIKEMARQLAAFPKKQFDMYRAKPRGFVSGEHFTLLSSPLNTKDKLLVYSNKCEDLDLNDIIIDVPKCSVDADEMTVTSTKSTKKKKKKKKKASTASDQASSICNGEMKPTTEGEKDSKVVIENKFLDSNDSGSRVATMNKNMVADISVVSTSVSCSDTTKNISNSTVNHSSDHGTTVCDFEGNQLDNEGTENEDIKDPDTENNDFYDITNYTSPPFGYPLATDKLIQSAIELLSCEPSKESNKTDQDSDSNKPPNNNETLGFQDSSSVSINSPVDVDGSIDGNDSSKDATSSPDPIDLKHKVDESIDGDVSNLSAWEDEGWQSQGRRSHRKKKKELASRDRSNSNQKNKKDLQKETKQNNNHSKRQNPRNTHNRNSNGNSNNNFLHGAKTSQVEKKNIVDKNALEMDNCTPDDIIGKSPKEGNNSEVESKAAFSYRDALLKAKPKPTEELHYNSDSGVDVNSVGSCDSAIHSPKMPNEFDLEEAVNFFMKACNEVTELHKQGKVVYYSGSIDPMPTNRKKPFRKGWYTRPKHHK